MIAFKTDIQLPVVEDFDEVTEKVVESQEVFKAGELVDGEIVGTEILPDGTTSPLVDIQFGDGGVAFGVQRESFEVL